MRRPDREHAPKMADGVRLVPDFPPPIDHTQHVKPTTGRGVYAKQRRKEGVGSEGVVRVGGRAREGLE